MGYSKFGLDSVEYDDYVVQEIQTPDSLYRIPLCAIDSIGFQQPEIRLNAAVRMMDDLGMTACVATSSMDMEAETGRIAFTASLPANLTPKVGDVLAGFDEGVYGESGFLGKVTAVRSEGGQIVCECDFVSDWGEIFDQVITVEQMSTDAAGNVRHRVAGLKSSGNYDRTIFDWSGRLQKELYHDDAFSVNVGVDLGFKATCSTVYNISGVFDKHVFLKLVFREGFSAGASIHATISGSHEWEIPTPLGLIPAIKFPAFFPIFQCDPAPSGFFRIGGTADMNLDLPKAEFGFSQTFVYDNKAENTWTFTWGNLDKGDDAPVLDADGSLLGAGSTFSGFAQIGAKSNIRLENNSWLSKLLEFAIGLEIYAGPKVEASVNLDMTSFNGYNYFKDSHLEFTTFSFDRELKYKWRVGRKKEERTLWSDTQKSGSITWYLMPDFLDTQAEVDNTSKLVKATVFPRRRVFATNEIGIGAIDENRDNAIVLSRFGKEYSMSSYFNEYSNSFPLIQFPYAGKFKIAPLMRVFGETFAALDEGKEIEVPPYIKIAEDSIAIDTQNGTATIIFDTNANNIYTRLDASAYDNGQLWGQPWLQAEIVTSATEKRTLKVSILSDNPSIFRRTGKVIVFASEGNTLSSDTLLVSQVAGFDTNQYGIRADFSLHIPCTVHQEINSVRNDPGQESKTTHEEHDFTGRSIYYNIRIDPTNIEGHNIQVSRSGDITIISGNCDVTSTSETSTGTLEKTETASFTLTIDGNNRQITSCTIHYVVKEHNTETMGEYTDTWTWTCDFKNAPGEEAKSNYYTTCSFRASGRDVNATESFIRQMESKVSQTATAYTTTTETYTPTDPDKATAGCTLWLYPKE